MFEQILVATDLTPISERAVELAVRLARTEGANLCIVHVVELPKVLKAWQRPGGMVDRQQYRAIVDNQVEAAKVELHHQIRWASQASRSVLIKVGEPAAEIARAALEVDADLLIVARGRGGRLGSTAERVVRLVGRTVLVAPVARGADAIGKRLPKKKTRKVGRRVATEQG